MILIYFGEGKEISNEIFDNDVIIDLVDQSITTTKPVGAVALFDFLMKSYENGDFPLFDIDFGEEQPAKIAIIKMMFKNGFNFCEI